MIHTEVPPIEPMGEAAVLVTLGAGISAQTTSRVLALRRAVLAAGPAGITDLVPAYATLLIRFDPLQTDPETLGAQIASLAAVLTPDEPEVGRVVEIPVAYGGTDGPDLAEVARHAGLSASEVIDHHAAGHYTVAFLGFLPGFPYLLGLHSRIHCPRLETPRQRVPAGSVGIAGAQTGIYPLDSPGGWRIIGRTEMPLFDPGVEPPALLKPGDRVRFVPIPGRGTP